MFTEALPQTAGALHPDWPEARFNLSGMFTQHGLILELIKIMEQAFECHLPIASVHGAPGVLWNAGRPIEKSFNPATFQSVLDAFYARNIGYFPTFTNHHLDAADLRNPLCNYLLDCIAKRPELNGVIVSSDLLSRYIADKYPALPQVVSIIRVTLDRGQGRADYYRKLGERFHRYVVHPDDCRNPELLDQLDRDKAEIILNENCAIHCPSRPRHYDVYARWQKAISGGQPAITLNSFTPASERQMLEWEMRQIMDQCGSPMDLECLIRRKRNCNLTDAETRIVYDLGFRHFKLQGRSDFPHFYAYDLTRYLLEPHLVAPVVYKTLLRTILNNGLQAR